VLWLAQKELDLPDGALSAGADSDEVRDFLGLVGETGNAIDRIFETLIIEGFADVGEGRDPATSGLWCSTGMLADSGTSSP